MRPDRFMPGYRPLDTPHSLTSGTNSEAREGLRIYKEEQLRQLRNLLKLADSHIQRLSDQTFKDYTLDVSSSAEVLAQLDEWIEIANNVVNILISDSRDSQSLQLEQEYNFLLNFSSEEQAVIAGLPELVHFTETLQTLLLSLQSLFDSFPSLRFNLSPKIATILLLVFSLSLVMSMTTSASSRGLPIEPPPTVANRYESSNELNSRLLFVWLPQVKPLAPQQPETFDNQLLTTAKAPEKPNRTLASATNDLETAGGYRMQTNLSVNDQTASRLSPNDLSATNLDQQANAESAHENSNFSLITDSEVRNQVETLLNASALQLPDHNLINTKDWSPSFRDAVSASTLRLVVLPSEKDGTPHSYITSGSFVKKDGKVYLVTAKHVVDHLAQFGSLGFTSDSDSMPVHVCVSTINGTTVLRLNLNRSDFSNYFSPNSDQSEGVSMVELHGNIDLIPFDISLTMMSISSINQTRDSDTDANLSAYTCQGGTGGNCISLFYQTSFINNHTRVAYEIWNSSPNSLRPISGESGGGIVTLAPNGGYVLVSIVTGSTTDSSGIASDFNNRFMSVGLPSELVNSVAISNSDLPEQVKFTD